jgi:ArsR family transcriptional regulator
MPAETKVNHATGKKINTNLPEGVSYRHPLAQQHSYTDYAYQHISGKAYDCFLMVNPDALIQALADGTRLRTLVLLACEGSLCVCELTAALAVSQPKMSRHLAALRTLDIVEDCRVANRVFYRIDPNLPDWARGIIDQLARGIAATSKFAALLRRLHEFSNRPEQRADFNSGTREIDQHRREISHAL